MTVHRRAPSRGAVIGLWAWFVVVLVTVVAVVIVNGGNAPRLGSFDVTVVVFWTLAPLYALLGIVIATRRPGNRIAMLFLVVSAGLWIEVGVDSYLPAARPDPPGALDVAATQWSNVGIWLVLVLPVAVLLHIFPTGRLPGPRWRWVPWAALLAGATPILAAVFSERLSPLNSGADWVIANPIGVEGVNGLEFLPAAAVFGLAMWGLLIGGVISMVRRFRRSTTVVRAQIKWVGYAMSMFMLSALVGLPVLGSAGIFVVALAALFIPVSVTLAITRFRLYDIDRIVGRTVTYAAVLGALAVLFAVVVLVPTTLLGDSESPAWLVAVATLMAFALFEPLRRRIQVRVDRRFDRARYDARLVVEEFSERVRDETELESVAVGLGEVAGTVFVPESLDVWVRDDPT